MRKYDFVPLVRGAALRSLGWSRPPNWTPATWLAEALTCGALAASRALERFDPARGVRLAPFLYRRILRAMLGRLRALWREYRRAPRRLDGDLPGRSDAGVCLLRGHDPQAAAIVHDVLPALPRDERDLLKARFFARETEEEIARRLGITQQAVSKRVLKALQHARAILEG